MSAELIVPALVALAPVLAFLAALLYLDSYKLVKLRMVVALVVCGAAAAGIGYLLNGKLFAVLAIDRETFARYVGPATEELLKGLVIVALIRLNRVGFLVDAAIMGFAVGSGFAVVENLYYLRLVPDAGLGTWIVRGFGTAIMHGGATALFAVMSSAAIERIQRATILAFVPGFVLALVLHAGYNNLFLSPKMSTLAVLVVLPPLFMLVFQRSERAVGDWLGRGFDADTEMLDLINSGRLSQSPVGQYLRTLKDRFKGPVVADILCYLRLYTELALRAKGILMMRESGFDADIDDETRAKFDEMRYLEDSIGKTGLLALKPVLHMSHHDLWQLYMLGK
ncbi:MAG TPA: PrsW family glutamic-type intramembrane protease [Casimicrobiaceae bacterium]|nr:PrsW family glutamic-type intramembrane protease [Casimicrobiaceae bacterium]